VSNHDIEGRVPPETGKDTANTPSGPPDSLERQLAKEREARQVIRDRLRHTEALAAESHALRSKMMEELERVTADRDRLRAEASIAAAVAVPDPGAPAPSRPASTHAPAADASRPRAAAPDLRDSPGIDIPMSMPATPAGGARAAAAPRAARGTEPTMSPVPPAGGARMEPLLGERPLKPPVRRGPWRALAMLGGLAAAVAGLAWLTGTMPSGLDLASLKPSSVSAPLAGALPAASAPALALDSHPDTPAAASPAPSATLAATTSPPQGAVPLPPLAPDAQLAAAPTAAGLVAPAATGPASVPPPVISAAATTPSPAPAATPLHGQSQLQAQGGLDVRLRKALDGEGITSIVEVDPANGHVLVADPQADHALRDRTDMLIRAVYAGASLPEPQIEHRWMSPMRADRAQQLQAQAQSPVPATPQKGLQRPAAKLHGTPPPTLSLAEQQAGGSQHELTNPRAPGLAAVERINVAPPSAGGPTKHVEGRPSLAVADVEELRPVVPAGRITASCMEDLTGKTSSRRAALTACMKRSCCSSAGNLNSDECRAYQKAYTYACGAG